MITRTDILEEARTWMRTRFQHQAMLKGVACDCIGFVGGVALNCGVEGAREWASDPLFKGYGREPKPEVLMAACNKYLDVIDMRHAQPADIYVMSFHKEPMHFALVEAIDPTYILHSYQRVGGVTWHIVDKVWRSRIVSAFRFRGLWPH